MLPFSPKTMVENIIEIPRLNLPTPCTVVVGRDIAFENYLPDSSTPDILVVMDTNLSTIYAHRFTGLRVMTIAPGEGSKSLANIEQMAKKMVEMGCTRKTFVLAFGGGVVSDVVGFLASIFMRGVDFGFISTSLLGQVDACVGGKNGVNVDGYKNILGTFSQPRFIICDLSLLSTLPAEEFKNGMAEVIKCGMICSTQLFKMIESNSPDEIRASQSLLSSIVFEAITIKAKLVEADPLDRAERQLLNLGHTFAHAIEKLSDGSYSHGQAVAIGLCKAAQLSHAIGIMDQPQVRRVERVIESLELQVSCPEIANSELLKAMAHDKKRGSVNQITLILLRGIGQAILHPMPQQELKRFLR